MEKKDTNVVATETNHSIRAVDYYLKDYNRVLTLYLDNKTPEYIGIVTKIHLNVINQYVNIIKQYIKEPELAV